MILYYTQKPIILYDNPEGELPVFVNDESMIYARWYEYWINIFGTLQTNPSMMIKIYPIYENIIAKSSIAQFSIPLETTGNQCFVLPLTICYEKRVDKFQLKFESRNILDGKITKIIRIAR